MSIALKTLSLNLLNMNFLLSGLNKIMNFTSTSQNFIKRFPFPLPIFIGYICILVAILIQIISPIIINIGILKKSNELISLGVFLLLLFTILATIIYHLPPIGKNYYAFMSNLSLVGCLLYILLLNSKIN